MRYMIGREAVHQGDWLGMESFRGTKWLTSSSVERVKCDLVFSRGCRPSFVWWHLIVIIVLRWWYSCLLVIITT